MLALEPPIDYALRAVSVRARQTVVISFDRNNTDLLYLTSHEEGAHPATAGQTLANCLSKINSTSQSLDPANAKSTVGTMSVAAADRDGYISGLMAAKITGDFGLRGQRLQVYWGVEGMAWADYQLISTHIIDRVQYFDGEFIFQTKDIQRVTQDSIFDPKTTRLVASLTDDAVSIPVAAAEGFFTPIDHDARYTVHPNQSVIYVQIENEVIACGPMVGQELPVIQRGALNTAAVAHNLKVDVDDANQTQVKEYIHLEGAAPAVAYALLTGQVYNGPVLPDHWHLGVDPVWVDLAAFQAIGDDLWDVAMGTGARVRISGEDKVKGQSFIEQQILAWINCYPPIGADGRIGLRRRTSILADAPHRVTLDDQLVTAYGSLKTRFDKVSNYIDVKWNYRPGKQDYTKSTVLIDTTSQLRWGETDLRTVKLRTVHTGAHTDDDIRNYFNGYRDAFAGPPLEIDVTCLLDADTVALQVGDIVRLALPQIRDQFTGATIDRSFEVDKTVIDWVNGSVKLSLFGSSQRAGDLILIDESQVLDNTFYEQGTALSSVLTVVGGVVTVSGALTGAANWRDAIYYHVGDLEIAGGVTVTFTHNIALYVAGFLTINGVLTGAGAGLPGSAGDVDYSLNSSTDLHVPGLPGYFGNTLNAAGVELFAPDYGIPFARNMARTYEGDVAGRPQDLVVGAASAVPYFNVVGGDLAAIPGNLRGSSGSGGRASYSRGGAVAAGGNGGAGGGGLMVLSRGGGFGANGTIDTSGAPGALAASVPHGAERTLYGGSGAGGAPGAVVWVVDGNNSPPALVLNHVANVGDSPRPANAVGLAPDIQVVGGVTLPIGGDVLAAGGVGVAALWGYAGRSQRESASRIIILPGASTPGEEPDPPPTPPQAFSAILRPESGIVLSCLANRDADFTGFRFYVGASIASGSLVFEGKATSHLVGTLPPGSYTFWAVAVHGNGEISDAVSDGVAVDGPGVPVVAGIVQGSELVLTWDPVPGSFAIASYTVAMDGMTVSVQDVTFYRRLVEWVGSRTFTVVAVDIHGSASAVAQFISTISPPPQPIVAQSFDGTQVVFSLALNAGDLPIDRVVITQAAVVVAEVYSDSWALEVTWQGSRTFAFAVVDSAGNAGPSAQVVVAPVLPATPSITLAFSDRSALLSWAAAKTSLPIDRYLVRHGGVVIAEVTQPNYATVVDWQGNRVLTVEAIDSAGNVGVAGAVDIDPVPPSAPTIVSEVIDNNVLFRYAAAPGSLPIENFALRRGAVFATAVEFAKKAGTSSFTTLFESAAATNTYWITAIDTAGNGSTPASTTAAVSQPPDYVFFADYSEFADGWPGAKTDALVRDGFLLAPADTSETWQDYINNGYATMQAEITAGFSLFVTPSPTTARYERVIDLGAVLQSSLITTVLTPVVVSGVVNASVILSYSINGSAWTNGAPGQQQVFGTNFRYIRVVVDFTADGNDLLELQDIETRLDLKLRSDAGSGTANAGDSGGTPVSFNVDFIDIAAINVTARGTSAITAIYDFTDVPNPTGFSVYLFNSAGSRVSGGFSWRAEGF